MKIRHGKRIQKNKKGAFYIKDRKGRKSEDRGQRLCSKARFFVKGERNFPARAVLICRWRSRWKGA
ncbi:MAG: hypothetical protein LBF93_01315, partial [Zoogloeaceae bacterium]|nr:hypothetical protein [Zoogloeaceae bacterium]